MKIDWVNHSSFLLQQGGISLLCDPWIEGYVFDNSWSLVSPTKFSYEDFGRVTHIWFSHEHPDHFYPPTLKSIPPEIRQRITVLFQATKDKRVVKFCRNLGFRTVLEVRPEWLSLSDDLRIFCQPVPGGDSWLAIKSGDRCVVNINDCIHLSEEELRPVKSAVGAVDALITQFSYASWWGNQADTASWQKAARDTLDKIAREIAVLEPRDVILAASFVFFCHQENHYMNEHINRVDRAYRFIADSEKARPIVLYPGDQWTVGEPWNSETALSRYSTDFERALRNPVKVPTSKVELDQLVNGALRFVRTLRRNNSDILLRRVPSTTLYLTDHNLSLRLGLSGLRQIRSKSYADHDIALSSSALLYCLRFPWGGETLMINGRFQAPVKGNHHKFFRWFSIAQANSRWTYYNREYYVKRLMNRVRTLCTTG